MDRHHPTRPTTRLTTRLTTLGVAVALLALAGCGEDYSGDPYATTTGATASLSVPGVPEGVTAPPDATAGAGWVTQDGDLWVVTFGSSSNPQIALSATADGQTVTVVLGEAYPDQPATADFVPTTSYVAAPEGVDSGEAVTVVLGDLGTLEISASAPGWVTGS